MFIEFFTNTIIEVLSFIIHILMFFPFSFIVFEIIALRLRYYYPFKRVYEHSQLGQRYQNQWPILFPQYRVFCVFPRKGE